MVCYKNLLKNSLRKRVSDLDNITMKSDTAGLVSRYVVKTGPGSEPSLHPNLVYYSIIEAAPASLAVGLLGN